MGTDSQKTSEAATLPAAAVAALERGNRIAAIKALRIGRNMGLKDAKAMVDDYVGSRPELQQSFAAARNRTIATKLVLAIVIVAALLLVLRFLSRP
jgi:ribosomal protein L7/L12